MLKQQYYQAHQQIMSIGKVSQTVFRRFCRVLQWCLICVFYTLLTSFSYLYLEILFRNSEDGQINQSLQQSASSQLDIKWSHILWLVIGVWIHFNMIYNYTMAVLVKPGTPTDLQYNEIKHISIHCKRCSVIKPPRTHHCAICNICVMQMDHHCPWIGQCVGHHNRSFFLNFISYTLVGLILIRQFMSTYMSSPQYEKDMYYERVSDMIMFQAYIFVSTLLFVLSGFSAFHWYLALSGKSTLECCFKDPRYQPSKNYLTNLALIFGTKNIFYMFMPQLRVIKNRGYDWSQGDSGEKQKYGDGGTIHQNYNNENQDQTTQLKGQQQIKEDIEIQYSGLRANKANSNSNN